MSSFEEQQTEIIPPPQKDPTIMNHAASADHRAERFYGAARLCGLGGAVQFRDGSRWEERELYMKAIELHPGFAAAYHNLALTLKEQETVDLLGEELDQKQLYAKAIECDPCFSPPYVNLAGLLAPGEVAPGGSGDRCSLLVRAVQLDPRCATAYLNLALALPQGAVVQLVPGRPPVSAATLLATSRQLDPTCVPTVGTPQPLLQQRQPSDVLRQQQPTPLPKSPARVPQLIAAQKAMPPVVVYRPAALPSLLGAGSGHIGASVKTPMSKTDAAAPAQTMTTEDAGAVAGADTASQ